jgi:hypothetical protein
MENSIKEAYSKIGRVWCPVLEDFVTFNRAGLQHLIRKRGIMRPKSEQRRRFALLRYAENIIKNPDAIVTHEIKNAELSPAEFWMFHREQDDIRITLTIRQIGKGNKHFFSIYGDKIKTSPIQADF